MRRREFLQRSAVIATPAMLGGCAIPLPPAAPETEPESPWLDAFDVRADSLARVLQVLGGNGAEFGEVFFESGVTSLTRLSDGQPGPVEQTTDAGAGLRAVSGERVDFTTSADLSEDALMRAATQTVGTHLPSVPLAPGRDIVPEKRLYPLDRGWRDTPNTPRFALLADLDRQIRSLDPAITAVELELADGDQWVLVASLDGRRFVDRRPMARLSAQVSITRDGETLRGFASLAGRRTVDYFDATVVTSLAERAVTSTTELFSARRSPAGEFPVLLAAGTSGVVLHEALGHALEADFVLAGASPFADNLGDLIANPDVNLVDDATLAGERGALHIDDEGEAGSRTVLVEKGQLRSFVHDKYSAARFDVAPTGNGRRSGWRHPPLPRLTSTYIERGSTPAGDLPAALDRGIIAEQFAGGRADPGGGRFRFRVSHGWYVENGRRQVRLRDFDILGSGAELLGGIRLVGDDLLMDEAGWLCGKHDQPVPVSHGMPSVIVDGLGVEPVA